MSDAIQEAISRHDAELKELRTDVHELRAGQDQIASLQTQMSKANDRRHNELRDLLQNRTTTSLRDVASVMQIILMGGAILSATIGGIIYVSGNANGEKLALLEYRLERIYGRTDWAAEWRKSE